MVGISALLLFLLAAGAGDAHADRFSDSRAMRAQRVVSGGNFTCAILANGAVRCWGSNVVGQLGYGNKNMIGDNETPGSVGTVDLGSHTAVALAAGNAHTCALLDDGTIRCWGYNIYGQLGYGNTKQIGDDETPASAGPVDLGAGRTAVAITAGGLHTCAILDNGNVLCWGYAGAGDLGYATNQHIGDNETPGSVGPVDLGVGRTAVAISAGFEHTCAILDNGTVRCWGRADFGQLGYGNTTVIGDNETPGSVGPVDLGPGRTAIAISAGVLHTCAILDNHTLRCWGKGEEAQLGYGNLANIGDNETPASVAPVDLGAGNSPIAVTAGHPQTCAIIDDGTVRCWGQNETGQLGYGNTTTIGDNETPASVGPVNFGGGHTAVSISAGFYHTCAQLDNGSVTCWGKGDEGQLGYGNTNNIGDNETPAAAGAVDYGVAHGALETTAGGSHTCALFDTGTIRCWGLGSSGQLGYASTATIGDNENPASGGTVELGHSAKEIAAGENHSCALLDNGTVRCWGSNASGQLGYGNTANIGDNETPGSVGPVDLGAGRSAVAISAGANHTCALLDNGTVRCWGRGAEGQLGYGNSQNVGDDETPGSVGPVDLGAGRSAIAIATGGSHTCALLDNGTVRCWGLGTSGQLGYSDTKTIGDNETPGTVGPVALGRSVREISAGALHTCATLDDGTVRCWGIGTNGRLGYGNTSTIGDNEAPNAVGVVSAGRSAYAMSSGGGHTCALLDNGTVRCWGRGAEGQLGYGNTKDIGDDELPSTAGPVELGGLRRALNLSVGANHTCATLDDGTVRCWGLNSSGQLGYGNTANVGDNETPGSAGTLDFDDDPPVAVNDSVILNEDVAAPIDVLGNDTDVDGGPKAVGSKTNGSHGTVAITGGGSGVTYTSSSNYCGPDSFTYALSPGGSSATVSVTVSCVDDPPVAVNDSATLTEDAAATPIDVLSNDTDTDGGAKSVASKTNGAHGTVAITGGGSGVSYLPDANYCGADSFTYTLNGGSTGTVSVTMTCVDDPPVAVNDLETVAEDSAATAIDVLANDTDVDGGAKSVVSKTNGTHGTVAITGGGSGLAYVPDPNYCGFDAFIYALNGGSAATVSITVSCVDDAPVAVNDSATLIEDASAFAIDVLANDTDIDAGPRSVASKTNGAHGTVAITGGGSGLSYSPDPDYCGPDSFTYSLSPGGSSATVSLSVTCDNDPPVAVNDSAALVEDASATAVDVLANDTDVDGGPKGVDSKTNGTHGTVAITGGGSGLTYLPDANYCGGDSFTYTLNGGSTATVSVTISCVDDPPTAVNDAATVAEDSSATAIDVLTNDTDIDGGPKTVSSKTNGSHGVVAITGGGSGLSYLPDPNYCGSDSFTYTPNGGSTATVSVTISCVDDPPTAVDDSDTVQEDAPATAVDVLTNDSDIDSGPKTVSSKTTAAHGMVAITGGGAGLTYQPSPNYCGPDSFTYTLNGGSTATVSISVACVDDAPTAVDDSAGMGEDASVQAIDVLANDTDIDGGAKTVSSKSNSSHGTVAITGGGSGVSYLPDANYCGPDSFTYTLNGGSTATVSVTVSCVDDPPSAVNDAATLAEDSSATAIDVLTNDTDIDGGPKAIASKTNGAHGTVAITGGGSGLGYSPDPNYCGPDSFTYQLNGGATATVSVTVSCVDDAPTAVDDSDTIQEDAPATAIDVLANDTDIDGGPKTVIGRTNGSHGVVALIGGGAAVTYTPAANYCGADSFTYTLNGGAQAAVAITVVCVDDPVPADPGSGTQAPTQTIIKEEAPSSSAPVVNITPGVGVVSGRRHPRVAVKGAYAFFTLTCKRSDGECAGKVTITANIPSVALGPAKKVILVKGGFRIATGRSVLVRAKLTTAGHEVLRKRSLRGVGAQMAIVDAGNGERGKIEVNLVRRPKASLLTRPGPKRRASAGPGPNGEGTS